MATKTKKQKAELHCNTCGAMWVKGIRFSDYNPVIKCPKCKGVNITLYSLTK